MKNQLPTFCSDHKTEKSVKVENVESLTGVKLLPYQKKMLGLMLELDEERKVAHRSIAFSIPRQNGKSYGARIYAVYVALVRGAKVMYSCHNGQTTYKMFEQIESICERKKSAVQKNLKRVCRVRGCEKIEFADYKDKDGNTVEGGSIEFSTRTNSGMRGGSYSVVIFDEAQELTDEQAEAILPTISAASKAPQQIFIGTPPSPTCAGTVFRRFHDNAHSGINDVVWCEWSTDTEPTDKNVEELAMITNPALGFRIADDTIKNEFAVMSTNGFRRERLGWWEVVKSGTERAIDADAWSECGTDKPLPNGRRAYGVKMTFSDIALCGAVEDGDKVRVSLIDRRNAGDGVQWVADWLNERYTPDTCVVIDGRNGVDLLIDKINWKRKGSVIKASMAVMTDASARLVERVANRTVTWNKLNEVLDLSARGAIKRKIGQGWGFGGDDPSPIEGCALALYGFEKSEKKGEQRIG